MKREITEYDTNNLDTLKFIRMCKNYIRVYRSNKKTMLLPNIAKEIWRMIQEDMFNVNYWGLVDFSKIINDIGYDDFTIMMYALCYVVVYHNEKDYIYYRNVEGKDCISLIGKPIYKFLNEIEEMLPYED